MLSPKFVKIIKILPEGLTIFVARKLVKNYLKKYSNIKIEGFENIQKTEDPKIFISNHLSNSDGLILSNILKEKYDPYFVTGVKLSNDPITNLGVKLVKRIEVKPNTADKEAISSMVSTVREGNNLLMFPEGTRSRNSAMIEGKKGILLIARLTKAKIVPIGLIGTEILLPVSESGNMGAESWEKADVEVRFGEGIELPKREKEEDKHQYDNRCMKVLMGSIASLLPEKYKGVYK